MLEDEKQVMKQAEQRSFDYLSSVGQRNVYPTQAALDGLRGFDEALPEHGCDSSQTLAMLDTLGSPATVVTNGRRYFGFVVGAALPAAAAAERLMLAWDQGAAMAMTSPACASIEEVARRWLLEILDLPSESGIGFGTSATACGLTCLTVARSQLLLRAGWDLHKQGVHGAPLIRVVVSETVHVTILKALRILGFGQQQIIKAPVDQHGRIDPERLPALDAMTILCLQAGEVNTGEFDPFSALIPRARQAGAWVHVDGAFGLWARASALKQAHTAGVEEGRQLDRGWPQMAQHALRLRHVHLPGCRCPGPGDEQRRCLCVGVEECAEEPDPGIFPQSPWRSGMGGLAQPRQERRGRHGGTALCDGT